MKLSISFARVKGKAMNMTSSTSLRIRPIEPADAQACGRIAFDAHQQVAKLHNFPPEHPNVEFSLGLIGAKLKDPNSYGVIAEQGGKILGSVFANFFPSTPIAAIGPMTVDPIAKGGVGQRLMQHALDEIKRRGVDQVRLVQSPSHIRSLALYSKLGFEVREPLMLVHGPLPMVAAPGSTSVRSATPQDLQACERLCEAVHGFTRSFELNSAIVSKSAVVVERDRNLSGYATSIGFVATRWPSQPTT